jgi:hypothetical protein
MPIAYSTLRGRALRVRGDGGDMGGHVEMPVVTHCSYPKLSSLPSGTAMCLSWCGRASCSWRIHEVV